MTQPGEHGPEPANDGLPHTLPVIEERFSVEKRRVETNRVHVYTQVREEQREIDAQLENQRVRVERVPRDEVLISRPVPRQEGDVFIFPVAEEIVVVETRWRLVEEVCVRQEQESYEETVPVTLSHQDVIVERTPISPKGRGTRGCGDKRTDK